MKISLKINLLLWNITAEIRGRTQGKLILYIVYSDNDDNSSSFKINDYSNNYKIILMVENDINTNDNGINKDNQT